MDFELVTHFGGEIVQEEEFFGGFVGEIWDLQSQIAVQEHGGERVFEVDGEFTAGAVGGALAFSSAASG